MYRREILYSVILVSGFALAGRVHAAEINCVGWWKLDEASGSAAIDSSGMGHHGVLLNRPVREAGRLDGAVRLDGINDYLELPIGTVIGRLTRSTFSIWVDWSGQGTGGQRIIDFGTGPTYYMYISVNYGGSPSLRFAITQTTTGGEDSATSSAGFPTGWHHVAVVIDPDHTAYVLYLDGERVSESTGARYTPQSLGTTTQNWLGRSQYGTDPYFNGGLDDFRIYDGVLTDMGIKAVMQGQDPGRYGMASSPRPQDGATDVPRDAVLDWKPGPTAAVHDVYLGARFEDVNAADRIHPGDVLVSQGQDTALYDPPGLLEFGRTYYWRVDEVNAAPDKTVYRGSVWSFTAEPYSYPIKPVAATASSLYGPDTPAERTIDGSGLNSQDGHTVELTDMWLSGSEPQPAWIQYEFDQVYKLDRMRVWNSNQEIETLVGYGAREVSIEASLDGITWATVEEIHDLAQATGEPNQAYGADVDLGGALAQYVRLTILSNWSEGTVPETGLAEVRFFQIPGRAYGPQPAEGATGVSPLGLLSWRPGREAVRHEVYIGTDDMAVAPVKTVANHQVDMKTLSLAYGKTYYWRIDEVNEVAVPASWIGPVWSFSTFPYAVVDDFEGYDDKCNRIYYTWIDGSGHNGSQACNLAPATGTGTGSSVGNADPPFASQTVMHEGRQSMPLGYNALSEAVRTFEPPQDWTQCGVKTLTLFFSGVPTNGAGDLYVKINGTKVPYNGKANDLTESIWTHWNIDLASVGGLKSVKTLTIGISGAGKGLLYIDDIRLYP